MTRRFRLPAVLALIALTAAYLTSAAQSRIATDGPPSDLTASAARLYEQYGAALSRGRRGSIANFYHYQGARIVFNGVSARRTREELRQRYMTTWSPPTYFAWDSLTFDSLSTSQVLVTGGFRWQSTGRPDTSRFIYAALLEAVDSGMAIVFEHETLRPSRAPY